MEKKQDRRITKTKKAIRNSFVKLLAEKEIDKIKQAQKQEAEVQAKRG